MKKTIAVLVFGMIIIISAIAPSCLSDCKRSDLGNPRFYTTQLIGNIYDISKSSQNITDTTVIRYNDLKISLRFNGKYYSETIRNFSLISSAYACDPIEPHSEEKLTNITITSNHDFDALHLAGTSLNDVFYASKGSSRSTMESYLRNAERVEDINFSLASAPEIQQEIQFTITYEFDGRLVKVLKYETPTFIISPI